MKKNVIITPTGVNSIFRNWLSIEKDKNNFDIIFICYEDNDLVKNLTDKGYKAFKYKGEKWSIIKQFFKEHSEVLEFYDFFWFPDDDLDFDFNQINKLFEISKDYDFWLSQPSADGYTSHKITNKNPNYKFRFTNFVEIMCPLMSRYCLKQLIESFDYSKSGWGLDILWPKILGFPTNKIAIIDEITINHTKPVGKNYSGRFEISPYEEMKLLLKKFDLQFNLIEYDFIK